MFERWCNTCERPMKCHNNYGELYCIGCKSHLGTVKDKTA